MAAVIKAFYDITNAPIEQLVPEEICFELEAFAKRPEYTFQQRKKLLLKLDISPFRKDTEEVYKAKLSFSSERYESTLESLLSYLLQPHEQPEQKQISDVPSSPKADLESGKRRSISITVPGEVNISAKNSPMKSP